ncbi:hypothetical protein BDA96_04G251000 [Sorghum bicolor]|uniref:Uncharacterized protein n=1 Tax=Sorghum bicolor TaxID=4558 RepID=A0A921R7H0_SORBI|nr:hypothetical protein BDA96_04G251000 [Sorghum bicolor]
MTVLDDARTSPAAAVSSESGESSARPAGQASAILDRTDRWLLVDRDDGVPVAVRGSGGGRGWGRPPGVVPLQAQDPDLVTYVLNNKDGCAGGRRDAKLEHRMLELSKGIKEMKGILYGNGADDPCEEACKQLTKEFFKKNTDTFRQFIVCLQYVNLDTQNDVTQVIANLQRQKVDSRLVASDYLEANLDLLEILMYGSHAKPKPFVSLMGLTLPFVHLI